jgi:exonuclease SbcD
VKILHTGDWHVGRSIRGRPRDDEHRQVLSEIAGLAGDEAVDLVVVAGDIFDAASPGPGSEEIVYRALLDLASVAPVVMVAGNHDHPQRLKAVAPLLQLGRVAVGTSVKSAGDGGVLSLDHLGVKIALVPFIGKRGIIGVEQLLSLPAAELQTTFADRVRRIIGTLCQEMTTDTINLLLGHLMVAGGATGGGERSAHLFEYAIPAASFPSHLNYVALGHLHRSQRMPYAAPVWYAGSPLQLDFGEEDERKSVLLVTTSPGLPAEVEEHPLQSGRRLRTIRGSLEQLRELTDEVGDDFLRVELEEAGRVGLADDVREFFPNAVEIRLLAQGSDPTRPVRVGREPAELFREYLQSTGVDDRRLEALFAQLLAEAGEVGG